MTIEEAGFEEAVAKAATQVAESWDDLMRFLGVFREACRFEQHHRREVAPALLLRLVRDHEKDVLGRVVEIATAAATDPSFRHHFWDIYVPFCEILPQLDFEPALLASSLEPVLRAEGNDMAGGGIYQAIEKCASRSQEIAENLIEAFLAHQDSPVASLALFAFHSLASFNLQVAHARALDLTRAPALIPRRVGIAALGDFQYSPDTATFQTATLCSFAELKASPDSETDYILARAYLRLIDQSKQAEAAFLELVARNDPRTQLEVLRRLFRLAEEKHAQPWFRQALLSISRTPSLKGHSLEVDHCLEYLARTDPEYTEQFLAVYVSSRAYTKEEEEERLPEPFNGSIGVLRQVHPQVFEALITRWFSSPDQRFHSAAWDLAKVGHDGSPDSGESLAPKLSKEVLDSLSEEAVAITLKRVVAHGFLGRPLTALITSGLHREPLTQNLKGFVEALLSDVLLYDYPKSAGDYLRSKATEDDLPIAAREAIRTALSKSDSYFENLKGVPRLNEFRSPQRRVISRSVANWKYSKQIMESAQRRSPILQLITHIPLKFGRSWATEIDGRLTEPSQMGEISHEAELPRGEMIDPLGQQLRRISWRFEVLETSETESAE